MNITPPVSIKFRAIDAAKVRSARQGFCPHCPRPIAGRANQTMVTKHTSGELQFLQCSRCLVVVALEREGN